MQRSEASLCHGKNKDDLSLDRYILSDLDHKTHLWVKWKRPKNYVIIWGLAPGSFGAVPEIGLSSSSPHWAGGGRTNWSWWTEVAVPCSLISVLYPHLTPDLPTYLPTYLPDLPTYLPTWPTSLTYLAYLPHSSFILILEYQMVRVGGQIWY